MSSPGKNSHEDGKSQKQHGQPGRVLIFILLSALLLSAIFLAIIAYANERVTLRNSLPEDYPGAAQGFFTQTPSQIVATLTPTQTATPSDTPTPQPTPTPDGPPVSLEDYERLFPGVFYKSETVNSPREHTVHIVIVELDKQSIDLMVTPREALGQRTSEFLTNYGLQLAINGDGWINLKDPTGLAVSEGEMYSEDSGQPTIYVLKNGEVKVGGNAPEKQTWHAISGSHLLVRRGQIDQDIDACTQPDVYCGNLAPRTSIGISANNYLILVLVEGPSSEPRAALTFKELAELHLELGSVEAIAMDGGGSTTLVVNTGSGPQILNNPTDGSERVVSNHLGIFARGRGGD
jgi:hypothetical protein